MLRWLAALLGLVFSTLTLSSPAGQRADASEPVLFRNVSEAAGLVFTHVNGASPDKHFAEIMGSGGLFFDFDNDGWIDVFLVDGGSKADPLVARTARHRLFRNRGNGSFDDVTATSGIRHSAYGMGTCAGDYDNDGLTDLYITNDGPNVLYRNVGNGAFTDVTATARVGSPLWSTSCAFVDVDRDGWLDLFVTSYVMGADENPFCGNTRTVTLRGYCHPLNFRPSPNVLYRNNGDGTFTDVTARSGIAAYRGNGLGVAVADYNDDGWPDIFVANDGVPDFLFHNEGDGRFTERGLLAGVSVASDGKARAGMGTAFGDVDGDGRLDLVVTNHESEMHSLFRNTGDGAFADATVSSGIGRATLRYVGFGVVFADFDNDGDLDLAIVNGHVIDNIALFRSGAKHAQRRLLLQNTGAGIFRDVSPLSGPGFAVEKVGRTVVAGDINNDGNLDLLITNNGGSVDLLLNQGGSRGNALLLRLIGTDSNRDAIGARLRLTSGARTQVREVTSGSSYLGQNDPRVHVGLGAATVVDRMEIRWPSGRTEVVQHVAANQLVVIREGEGIVTSTPLQR
jgi:enediyne biosynthesis protein E4